MNPDSSLSACPQCHAPLPPDAPQGLCPACLMAVAGLATDQDTLPLTAADLPELADIAVAFPDLEIIEKIGQGGMGVVFKARQPKLDRLVALKVLPKALAATPGFPERFTREGRVLARLSHPSIVTVHDFGESGGYCFLIMEYVDGVNLRQAMRAGRFTPEQALKLVPDVCAALQAAHEQGVLHRDIKPENILLDSKGRIKIADFGIAKLLDDRGADLLLTQSGAKLGTAPYMAPEQIEQPSTVDHRADIYSLGVVLYEMLTGELPLGKFAAPSEKSAVGGNIDEIVFRALSKESGRRQQSAGEDRGGLAARIWPLGRCSSVQGNRLNTVRSDDFLVSRFCISLAVLILKRASGARHTVLSRSAVGRAGSSLSVWWRAAVLPSAVSRWGWWPSGVWDLAWYPSEGWHWVGMASVPSSSPSRATVPSFMQRRP